MNYDSQRGGFSKKKKGFILLIPLLILGLGAVVMFLWNAILPDVVGVSRLSYWQALGLLLLSRILVGGFHFGSKHKGHSKKHVYWRNKWMNMSEEERAKLKEAWRKKRATGGEEQNDKDGN